MPEAFLDLDPEEQADILTGIAPELGRTPGVLEKDVWVCWVLQQLFTMPGRAAMAFKGGTSLSKVFDAIHRFSEDVDVTLDYRGAALELDPFAADTSRSRLTTISDQLKAFVRQHAHEVVKPHFEAMLATQAGQRQAKVEIDEAGEKIHIHYPTVIGEATGYLTNRVLIELGGRNITEPNAEHLVRPYAASAVEALAFPEARVTVLSPARTFWEKATLMHVECHRRRLRVGARSLSRHWYDVALLSTHAIGASALSDRELLADVVKHKKAFFNASYAHYDACLQGGLQLLPEDADLRALEADYAQMKDAGMFYEAPPPFSTIVEQLRSLQQQINA